MTRPWCAWRTWWYRCDVCSDKLTGADLKASPVIHVVGTYERIDTGRYAEVYRRYGGTTSMGGYQDLPSGNHEAGAMAVT